MRVSDMWYKEIAKDIIGEFEQLLCNHDIKINNENLNENKFEREDSYINEKDYKKLEEKVIKQLEDLADYVEYKIEDAA